MATPSSITSAYMPSITLRIGVWSMVYNFKGQVKKRHFLGLMVCPNQDLSMDTTTWQK